MRRYAVPTACKMSETIHFHSDLYRRDALEHAAEKARQRARIELADLGPHVVASLEPLAQGGDGQEGNHMKNWSKKKKAAGV